MSRSQILLEPIGRVANEIREAGRRDWRGVVSDLILDQGLGEALDGLEEFSHLVVLFWMHGVPRGRSLAVKTHPQGRSDLPLVGLFSTRSPYRPNPIGVAVVELLERRGNVLRVAGLDAIDGTPLLDIKPYLPRDALAGARAPQWVEKLDSRW